MKDLENGKWLMKSWIKGRKIWKISKNCGNCRKTMKSIEKW